MELLSSFSMFHQSNKCVVHGQGVSTYGPGHTPNSPCTCGLLRDGLAGIVQTPGPTRQTVPSGLGAPRGVVSVTSVSPRHYPCVRDPKFLRHVSFCTCGRVRTKNVTSVQLDCYKSYIVQFTFFNCT